MGVARVRISVGVTGHRHFNERTDKHFLEHVDNTLCRSDWRRAEHRDLFSGLAEGADLIVAERAVAMGWNLKAILAKPLPLYYDDFTSSDSKRKLDHMLSLATEVISVAGEGCNDAQCYMNVGDLIIENACFLIAVCDLDLHNPSPGGTAWVVNRFIESKGRDALFLIPVTRSVVRELD